VKQYLGLIHIRDRTWSLFTDVCPTCRRPVGLAERPESRSLTAARLRVVFERIEVPGADASACGFVEHGCP